MTDPTLRLALAETPDEIADALAGDPTLTADAARWTAVRAAVRRDLAASLPEADLLVLHALDAGDLDADERRRLDAARPRLDAALARHPGLAAASDLAAADARAFSELFDAAMADTAQTDAPARRRPLVADRAADRAADRTAAPASRPSRSRWVWRTAALVGVIGFAAVLTNVFMRDRGFETITAQTAQTVTLADGSTAELAAGSVLMVPEAGGDVREARLRSGEALFHIRHDAANPFSVETPNADVGVLGTVFAVRVANAGTEAVETRVTLLSGRVEMGVRGAERRVALAPGQASTVAALNAPTAPAAADLGAALAFLPDIELRDVAAREAARLIGERFGIAVEVDDALAAEPVSAQLRMADGPENAARALALALGGHVAGTPEALRITAD